MKKSLVKFLKSTYLGQILTGIKNNTKKNNEILWAQIFNSTINQSGWLHRQSFSPGRWALGYPALYILYRILDNIAPQRILEFGLGESTKITSQYLMANPGAELQIVEQDENWLNFFSQNSFDVKKYTTILPIEQQTIAGKPSYIYSNLEATIGNRPYNLIIVDGPWASDTHSRPQIVEIVQNNMLCDQFAILIDDYDRKGERQTVARLCSLLDQKGIKYNTGIYEGVKQTMLICSSEYRFLTSL